MVLIDPADYDGPVRVLVCRLCGNTQVDPDQDRDSETVETWCECVGGVSVADARYAPFPPGGDE